MTYHNSPIMRGLLRTVTDLLRLSNYQISSLRSIGPNSKGLEELRRKRQTFINEYSSGLIRQESI